MGVVGTARSRGPRTPRAVRKPRAQRNGLGRPAAQGESPVREARAASAAPTQSTSGHEEPGGKQGGPPSKAEHSPATDSEPVP